MAMQMRMHTVKELRYFASANTLLSAGKNALRQYIRQKTRPMPEVTFTRARASVSSQWRYCNTSTMTPHERPSDMNSNTLTICSVFDVGMTSGGMGSPLLMRLLPMRRLRMGMIHVVGTKLRR